MSKYAREAQMVYAEFTKSSVRSEDCPDGLPEFEVVGRKRFALMSNKPGYWNVYRLEYLPNFKCLLQSKIFAFCQCPIYKFGRDVALTLSNIQQSIPKTLDYAVSKIYAIIFIHINCKNCLCIWQLHKTTVLLHFFLNRYAAALQELRTDWSKFTKDYFIKRSTLVSVFQLIDASIPSKKLPDSYQAN
ncbi:uncharacterized protein LOC111300900 [Durio zibethinus]|uniref:Uncharacterized protein LOC111300900 n=1 Tax=Durio zibethinus TaxID=66656 RepID=A0A6P5ZIK9_DURZI|nr:uncharacterized protein LOC111300900 [Durio zibethinus]